MFRKVSKKPKVMQSTSLRRQLDDEDENDLQNGDQEDSIQERIQETQRKHKLLASLPMASGDDKPKKRRFLATTTTIEPGNEDDTNHDLTVLALKHKQAMDEYIRGQLTTNKDNNQISSTTLQNDNGDEEQQQLHPQQSASSRNDNVDPETLLYLELAAAAVPSKVLAQDNEDDAKGAAILVGGTGIAEVILPKTTTFNNPTPTGVRYSRNPNVSSAVSNFKDHAGMDKNLLPAGFRSMVPDKASHEEAQPPAPPTTTTLRPLPDGHGASTTTTTTAAAMDAVVDTTPTAVDDSRPGFAALVHHKNKGKTTTRSGTSSTNTPSSNKPRGYQHEKDQQAFSKFVKRQREHR